MDFAFDDMLDDDFGSSVIDDDIYGDWDEFDDDDDWDDDDEFEEF